jgi:hypothetical protein
MSGKKGISAETATALLSLIIECNSALELYILFADVKAAYDNLWKEAVWAKLADAHPALIDSKRVAALYEHFRSYIDEPDFRSQVVESVIGVPQGGPRSGDVFCFFTSDLPEELKTNGVGVEVLTLFLVCLVYLDDWTLPITSEQGVIRALNVLHDYGQRWSMTWALPKIKVLPINVKKPPSHWPFGPHRVPSVSHETYLAVVFNNKQNWNQHFKARLNTAKHTAANLRSKGLLGGRNNPEKNIQMTRAILWSQIDYGRGATDPHKPGHLTTLKNLATFQYNILREILNLSQSVPRDGLLGETGDIPDHWRHIRKQVAITHQLLSAPPLSIPRTVAEAAYDSKTGVVGRAIKALLDIKADPHLLKDEKAKPALKQAIMLAAQREWRTRVASNRRIAATYTHTRTLTFRKYLSEAYKGRTILLKLRLDDLPLGAASYKLTSSTTHTTRCAACGQAPETRLHFALNCKALSNSRCNHPELLQIIGLLPQEQAFETILLARPRSAADNLTRAKLVAAYLYELWHHRCHLTGSYPYF